jgi:nitrate reductase (NAD(P)H)
MEACEHVILRIEDSTERKGYLERKYTPITVDEAAGHVDIALKVYTPPHNHNGVHFDNGGKMTLALQALAVGDTVLMAGPTGSLKYVGNGHFQLVLKKEQRQLHADHVVLLAGGTGITPGLQIIKRLIKHQADPTSISLVFANQTHDIFLGNEIVEAQKVLGLQRFNTAHVIEHPNADFKGFQGRIHQGMLEKCLRTAKHSGHKNTLVLVCGPRGMVSECAEMLTDMGLQQELKKHTQAVFLAARTP